jgi:hypothetical protein
MHESTIVSASMGTCIIAEGTLNLGRLIVDTSMTVELTLETNSGFLDCASSPG